MDIHLPNKWEARAHQSKAWSYLHNGGKRAMLVWHRRAGKDDLCLHYTACASHERVGNYWHMLPEANQARKAMWEAINPHTGLRRIDEAFPKAVRETTREDEMLIRFKCGSTWQLVGSDNFDSLVGSPPIGLVFSEYALAKPAAWDYLRPILLENGGWAIFNFTPRGHNHAYDLYEMAKDDPYWFCERLTVNDTTVFTPEQIESEKNELFRMGKEAKFLQEYMCSFEAAIEGAYYAKEITELYNQKRINTDPHDPSIPVLTCWDIGWDDHTAIWFMQWRANEIHLIDYYENRQQPLDHYIQVLQNKGMKNRYIYQKAGINGIRAIGPHDMMQHDFGTGKTTWEMAKQMGVEFLIAPNVSIEDGINATRMLFNKFRIHETNCRDGLDSLKNYQATEKEKHGILGKPLHNWASHAADALRYGVLCYKDRLGGVVRPIEVKPMTLNDMWGAHEKIQENRQRDYY